MTETPLRFAVLGCGVIGKHHAAVLDEVPGAELAAVIDIDPEAARALAEKYGVPAYEKLDDVLALAEIDAVAVCTPSGDHAEQAVAVLRANKHVVVEKPIDITMEAADELAEAERKSAGRATVISQHRFDPASQVVRAAVVAGDFGPLTSAVASVAWWRSQAYYDSGAWRGTKEHDGGGALMNQSIHTIDLLVWMLGEPVEITAYGALLAHDRIDVEDTAVAIVRFENGALATIHGTTAAYPGTSARLQVHGARGSAVIDDDRLTYFHVAAPDGEAPAYGGGDTNQAEQADGTGRTAGADPSVLSNAHGLQYADFLDAIRNDREPLVTVAEGSRTLSVVLAIYESAASGEAVTLRS
ncbi:Gfo/Idh/MocA family protein [Kribbella solani]|uniref:Gfo/Idh/MocA family protein n=1 Tax=Kribbella solani TaxID=236067 RepID=UPI0029AA8063|nr:Gfo/Idh/MocA family oxidoreductase [Kribbella solani]MDX2967916.1 Gfo/Idh/MocA family oxidoreductase [Kribbella solani]